MNLCGMLVHARPGSEASVRRALESLDGVTVHHATEDHRLVITVEDTQAVQASDQGLAVHRVPGVVSAALVYHHFDPESEPVHGPV